MNKMLISDRIFQRLNINLIVFIGRADKPFTVNVLMEY